MIFSRPKRLLAAVLALLLTIQVPLLAAEPPTTWEHLKALPVDVRQEGFFSGLATWLREDWRMTVHDGQRVAGTVGSAFRGARAALRHLRGRPKAEVLASAHLPEVCALHAQLVDNLDRAQLTELAGVAVTDEAGEQVARARLKREVMAAAEQGARELTAMDAPALDAAVQRADAAMDAAEHASEPPPAAAPAGAKASGILPKVAPGFLAHLMPKRWAEFMFSDNAWLAMLPVHMLLTGIIIQSTSSLTGAAAGAAVLLTSLFAVGGISVSWGVLAATGTASILSYKLIKWLVHRRGQG